MVLDKLKWARGSLVGGNLFALIGAGSIIGFGLSHVMEEENYNYYFLYKAENKFF